MTVASFIATQRTDHGVPHASACRALGVAYSTFYKWRDRPPTRRQVRRAHLEDLIEAGWVVSKNTVADSMVRQGLYGRKPKRRKGLTRPRKTLGWRTPAHALNDHLLSLQQGGVATTP